MNTSHYLNREHAFRVTLARFAMWVAICTWAVAAQAQLQVLSNQSPQCVFAGVARTVTVTFRNPGDKPIEAELATRLYQTSSATAVRLGESPWKKLQLLPRQTIIESATMNFPPVKAETRFLIQWIEGTSNLVGKTEVLVYPTNLLVRLKTLVGEVENALGMFDPANQLKPLLRTLAVEFQDLIEEGTDKFRGKLAIFGPFDAKKQMHEGLAEDIRSLVKRGVAVVWLQPPPGPRSPLRPSFYTMRVGNGAVVVAQGEMVLRLAENPQAQLNLIRLAEAALRPEPLDLPETRNAN